MVGLIVLSRWTRAGSYIVMFWLVGIAVNLVTIGMFYDLAMRDVQIAIGAFVLSQPTTARKQQVIAKLDARNTRGSQFAEAG
jgi:hypothetical protein